MAQKTNTELVKFAHKALNEDWGYCLGSFGNILTQSFFNQKLRQGGGVGAYNTKHKAYLQKYLNRRVSDCYGLVKAFVWWNNGNVKYNASQDRNQEGAYSASKEKGPISSIPEIPGLILWMKGHAGIYIGNGEFIECVGAPIGMRKGKIQNGKVVSGSKFTHWFKDTYITYEDKKVSPGSVYKDVPITLLSAPYIKAAKDLNLMQGVGEGNFAPKEPMTREQGAILSVKLYEAITGKKVVK